MTTVSQLLVWEPKHRRRWILCLIGGVNRYVGQLSVNISVVCQSWTGGADTRPIYNRYVTDTRPTVHRYIADTLPLLSRLTVDDDRLMIGRYSDRYSTDTRSMINRYSTDTRPTFSRHVDLYRLICRPTLDRYSADTRVDISIDTPIRHQTLKREPSNNIYWPTREWHRSYDQSINQSINQSIKSSIQGATWLKMFF